MADHQHNTVHVKVERKVAEPGWNGARVYTRFDVVDRHKGDAHFYVRSDSYLGQHLNVGDELEIRRK